MNSLCRFTALRRDTTRACVMSLLLFLAPARAADIPLHIQVTIKNKPCTVNGGQTKDIDFGNVMTSSINKGNAIRDIPFVLDCGAIPPPAVDLFIQTTSTLFDHDLAGTSIPELGISIEDDTGKQYSPNTIYTLTTQSPPAMKAVLRLNPDAPAPAEGVFTATATFLVTYN